MSGNREVLDPRKQAIADDDLLDMEAYARSRAHEWARLVMEVERRGLVEKRKPTVADKPFLQVVSEIAMERMAAADADVKFLMKRLRRGVDDDVAAD